MKYSEISAHQTESIQTIVSDLLKSNKRPAAVKEDKFDIQFGEDWTGAPGVWVLLMIENDQHPSRHKIEELNEFAKLISSGIIDSDLGVWPYIQFVTPKVSKSRAARM